MYVPIGPKTNKRHVFTNNQAHIVTSGAVTRKVVDEATKLVVWLSTSKTAQDLIVEIGPNAMPVLKSTLNSPKYLAGPPASLKILNEMVPDYVDPQTFIGWNEWRDAVAAALRPAFANKKSVSDAATDAARAGDLVLQKIPS
jgi:ABC-type glycerol-3-phosphate transport system substrate-binding protein